MEQADPNLILEAKSWLVGTITSLREVAPSTALACFLPAPSPSGPSAPRPPLAPAAERQLLQICCQRRAPQIAALLSSSPSLLRAFFSQSDATATSWFGAFSMGGISSFGPGAAALANFSLRHRDDAWRHLVWAGRHPQAPVAAAAKPHYFCELDVPATVKKLSGSCPGFWESRELRKSLEGGEWMELDLGFCSQVGCGVMGLREGGDESGLK